jgi:hypothetical protein
MTDTETSFARAMRIAEETKAAKWREYHASPQRWRTCDWSGADALDPDVPDFDAHAFIERPVEIAAFKLLHMQTMSARKPDVQDFIDVWREVRVELALRELLAAQNTTLLYWDEQQQRLIRYPTTRGPVAAVVVPHKRKAA